VRAAFLQNAGIGRGIKVGKESILGAVPALETWETRDHAAVRARERSTLDLWLDRLRGLPGLEARIVPDLTANPLDRLELSVDPREAGTTASTLAAALAGGDPPVIVRDHEAAQGHFYLDPCNLHPGEADVVADRIADTLRRLRDEPVEPPGDLERRRFESLARWPG
jgi:D-glucosaminate-6-phosphate ammonia-lyase